MIDLVSHRCSGVAFSKFAHLRSDPGRAIDKIINHSELVIDSPEAFLKNGATCLRRWALMSLGTPSSAAAGLKLEIKRIA